ncbi:MAG: nucleotide sugar dehydrogenase [Candidatus Aminicenantes bacterium]|nr:nucleotide sugar dehydrogenase [Candidatus Aminicenantes bacterium]
MEKTIGIIGLWHLGCVLCAAWCKLGHTVVGFDDDTFRIENLKRATPPIYEPGLSDAIREGLGNGKITFSDDIRALASCDFIFLSYDTPVREDDSSDTAILEKAIEDVRPILKDGAILIVSSQSPSGLCRELRTRLRREKPMLELAYSPENLRLGDAIRCYLNPGRIILGAADTRTREQCESLFSQIPAEILSMSMESAEMVKHGINSFLAMSIVFANHLADICESAGARIDDVVAGMKSDPRIGQNAYLAPGIGFSGGTLGRDLKVLDQKNRESDGAAKIFGLIHTMNNQRKFSILKRIEKIVGRCEGSSIGILGITYKPGTSTLRRSLPLEIVDLLLEKKAEVRVFDPKADYTELSHSPKFQIAPSLEKASHSVDLLVLLTEWPEFKDVDWEKVFGRMRRPVIFDTKNFLDRGRLTSLGFEYHSVGR